MTEFLISTTRWKVPSSPTCLTHRDPRGKRGNTFLKALHFLIPGKQSRRFSLPAPSLTSHTLSYYLSLTGRSPMKFSKLTTPPISIKASLASLLLALPYFSGYFGMQIAVPCGPLHCSPLADENEQASKFQSKKLPCNPSWAGK